MTNTEYLKTLSPHEFVMIMDRVPWCLKQIDCSSTNCMTCLETWLQQKHVEYTNIIGVIKFKEDSLRKSFMKYGIEPLDCVDGYWTLNSLKFTDFMEYILRHKNDIEGKFTYTQNDVKLMMNIKDGKIQIHKYSVTWKDICNALRAAGINDTETILKVSRELNVY